MFELETDELPEYLTYRPDPTNPEGHGFIEPARRMRFEEYQAAVRTTRDLWQRIEP